MKSAVFLLFMVGLLFPSASWAEDEVDKVRNRCQGDKYRSIAYDCDCITSAFKDAFSDNPSHPPLQVYSRVMMNEAARCLQPEKIHANSLGNCGGVYSQHQKFDNGNLGKTKFCHCVADETVKSLKGMNHFNVAKLVRPNLYAFDICGLKKEYATPTESSLPKKQQAAIETLPAGRKISTTDDAIYLIILNKNFDLDQLDPVRFAMSATYKPHRNNRYVTPKDYATTTLPKALIKRGAVPPGKITLRAIEEVPTVANIYNQAILVKGPGLKAVMHEIKRVRTVTSVDYYVFAGEEIYLVPDIASHLQK